MQKRFPLGFISIKGGRKPIYAFNDFFLNYTFHKKENWRTLRQIINILLEAYALEVTDTVLQPIADKIIVTTQFKHYMKDLNAPKRQDFEIKEVAVKKYTYVEMQGRARSKKPIEDRAVEYSVLGIGQNPGFISNQIWLLAENVEHLLHGGTFANYLLKEESSGVVYPNTSCIMFVNLQRLSCEGTAAGELASFLLGKTKTIKSGKIKKISNVFMKSCDEFCNDKGVKKRMSVKEKWQEEAWFDGEEHGIQQGLQQGIQQGANKLAELIKTGLSVDEALKLVNGNTT